MQADLPGPAGRLEALLEGPARPAAPELDDAAGRTSPDEGRAGAGGRRAGEDGAAAFAAVVCHPHPQLGGTMHTHAAYRLAKAVRAKGGVALRFNFRGVGRSEGRYGGGDGEAEDARAALRWLAERRPGLPLLACGFSFGAWMALLAGGDDPRVEGFLLAGLALRGADLERFRDSGRVREVAKPVAVVQAQSDQFGTPGEVREALAASRGPRRLTTVPGATHLFTEDLGALQREAEAALDWLLGGGR